MKIENLEVRTNPFKKSPARKKDGLHQVKIRVFIGKLEFGKFRIQDTLEIKVLDDAESALMMRASDFENIDKNKPQQYHIIKTELLAKDAVKQMANSNIELTSKNLFDFIHRSKRAPKSKEFKSKENEIWNDEVKKFFQYPIPESVWEEFLLSVKTDDREAITEEEISDIADGLLFDRARSEGIERVEKMDYNARYKDGYFNKNNIFEVFGFCWSLNPKNGEPLIADSYKSVIYHLNDFRFNEKPSESVNDFNNHWIDEFLQFKIKKGYPKNLHFKNYDPFTILKYRQQFVKAKREIAREKTFQALVKRFKKYIDILQTYDLITYSKNTNLILASDYLPRKSKNERYTRREHSLNVKEFDVLAETDFQDKRLNLARDMFIIATLGGGFRPNELYDNSFYIEDNRLHIHRSKQDTNTINPIFGQLKSVIQHHGGIPNFLKIQDFRDALKEIAKKLNFKRKIKSPDTRLDSKEKYVTNTVSDLFNAYFARKTYVTILNSLELTEEQIIEFTSHADQATLKYYKGRMTIEDKEKLLGKKLESNDRPEL